MIERNNYSTLPSVGPYSTSVKYNETLYLSGLTAFGTESQSKDVRHQVEEIFKQINFVLQEESISINHIIKVNIFVKSMSDLNIIREALQLEYKGNLPASSIVQVSDFFSPDVKVEIESMFAIPDNI